MKSKLLIFKLGDGKYACNTFYVDRFIKYENLTYLPSAKKTLEGLYNHEGNVIKIYSLSKRLGLESEENKPHKKIIIVKNNNILTGIVVDEVLEVINYDKVHEDQKRDIKEVGDLTGVDFKYVEDMILINDEIIVYLDIKKIVQIELEES